MILPRKCLNEGGESGGGAADDAGKQPDLDDAEAGKATDEGGDVGKKGGEDKASDKKPDAPTVDSLTKDLADRTSELDHLKSKLGKQSDKVGILNKTLETLKSDPRKFLTTFAKQAGVKLNFEDEKKMPDLKDALADEDTQVGADAIMARLENMEKRMSGDVAGTIDALRTDNLAREYKDWEDLSEDRDILDGAITLNQISKDELLQLAARGQNLPQSIEVARKEGKDEYIKELATKNAEQIDGDGGVKPDADSKDIGDFEDILGIINAPNFG